MHLTLSTEGKNFHYWSTSSSTLVNMTTPAPPAAALSNLPKADGSARYSFAGYTVTASVNGPIEAQRRDEHPYEAHVDIIVRPASGVGGKGSSSMPSRLTVVAHSHPLRCVFRDQRAASRISPAVVAFSDHSGQKLPPVSHSGHPPGRDDTGERLCQHKARPRRVGKDSALGGRLANNLLISLTRTCQPSPLCFKQPSWRCYQPLCQCERQPRPPL